MGELKEIIPVEYDIIGRYSKNLHLLGKDKKIGIIDEKWKIVVDVKYDAINLPFNNTIILEKDGKFGILNLE